MCATPIPQNVHPAVVVALLGASACGQALAVDTTEAPTCELTVTHRVAGDTPYQLQWRYGFDEDLRPVSMHVPRGSGEDVVQLVYDGSGQVGGMVVTTMHPQTRTEYDLDEHGYEIQVRRDRDNDGTWDYVAETEHRYDEHGDLRRSSFRAIVPENGAEARIAEVTYRPTEDRRTWTHQSHTKAGDVVHEANYGVDGRRKMIWRDTLNEEGLRVLAEAWSYDRFGNVVGYSIDGKAVPSAVVRDVDALGRPIEGGLGHESWSRVYDDDCGGVALPDIGFEPRFRFPGTH